MHTHRTAPCAHSILFVTSQRTTHQICNIVEKQNSRNQKQPTWTKKKTMKKKNHNSIKVQKAYANHHLYSKITPDLYSEMQMPGSGLGPAKATIVFLSILFSQWHRLIVVTIMINLCPNNSSCVWASVRARVLSSDEQITISICCHFFPNSENYFQKSIEWKLLWFFFSLFILSFILINFYL